MSSWSSCACPGCPERDERIAQLEATVRELNTRLGINATNSGTPPSAKRLLTVVQTRHWQGQSVLSYLHAALVAHRNGLPAPSLLSARGTVTTLQGVVSSWYRSHILEVKTMFSPDEIETRVRARPFVPVRIVTSSGQSFDIYHPALILIGR
ncbi:MAG: hypothetical protein ACYC3I_20560 [Gemmataceae bacterium]